ncbi:hypothetical protein O181_029281 [Austropuccinia psidii MF-1]|uniref:Glucanase n=1 Tax=Austropuccinia psidii MF-1 TaxID=1389203 RepID=A0A9Q3H359_9BASI|nr:hypothetical protein [Austropuccinia psidii MF-1]
MIKLLFLKLALTLLTSVNCQQISDKTPETQPPFSVKICTDASKCEVVNGTVTLDANWRWLHDKDGKNCYTGNKWDTTLCPDGDTCAANCALDGADYKGTYGITSTGDALTLRFVTHGPYSVNVGSRLYFLNGKNYQMFKLKNKQFTFTVDVSKLGCGLNGALYFSAMEEDGGMKKYPTNKAGAVRGTGYCDAQCPQDIKFIGGRANSEKWVPSETDPNTGTGLMGCCCPEMDIWEANKISQAFTPHSCSVKEPTVCTGDKCGAAPDARYKGLCDKDGCDFASYRWGAKEFYGPKKTVDTDKPLTVITQFITSDNTDTGELVEIRRIYEQDGKTIQNEPVKFPGLPKPADSLTQPFCDATKKFTGDTNDFAKHGGLKSMGDAMDKGMVLVMSLWDDQMAEMKWLDSNYPTDKPKDAPGVARGTCDADEGKPSIVRQKQPDATVVFSNVSLGPITSKQGSSSSTANPTSPKVKCRKRK